MCIKVLDFGVAKAPDDTNFSLTQTSSVVGSPGYMSPEQLKSSKGATVRSDIWSLGIVMYELVSGVKPWQGESITELALKVAMDPCPPLAGRVPWEFEAVVAHCLEKDPAKRYQDVADLAVALAPFAGPRGPEMARAVARVLRGANTPMPITPASSLQTHAMEIAVPDMHGYPVRPSGQMPPASSPTTLRHATGVVSQSPSQVSVAGKRPSKWKLPVIMAGGAAIGITLALVIMSGKKNHASPAEQPEAHQMASTGDGSASSEEQAKKEAAGWAEQSKEQDAVAKANEDATKSKDDAAKKQADAAKQDAAAKLAEEKKQKAEDKKQAELAKKDAAVKAAEDKKQAELAKKEAAKAEAAKLAEDKKQAAAKAAEDKKEREAAKKAARDAARAAAAKKAAAAKQASTTTKTTTTKAKDVGDSRQ
jgi:hypothetical protein